MEKHGRKTSLQIKLHILILGIILVISSGLLLISYYIFCSKVADHYEDQLLKATAFGSESFMPQELTNLWNVIKTDEYKEVRDRAEAENNEDIIVEYLKAKPSWYSDLTDDSFAADEEFDLYTDYVAITMALQGILDFFDISSVYIQIESDGVTYNIADPAESIINMGTIEEPIREFRDYPDNSAIPPTIYESDFGWLYTAVEPILDIDYIEPIATVGVDIDMTDVMKARHSFIVQSILFVILLTAAAFIVSSIVMRRIVIRPLDLLANAATDFANVEGEFKEDDVIQLDIRSNDEIGELYHEIRSMESRILKNTEKLTKVTAEKERVSTELRTASRIQASMLPDSFPAFPDRTDFDLFASMNPAKEVGGDFYDYFLVDDRHLALVIADVSDKGVPAALFMMATKILLNYCTQLGGSPGSIFTAVNNEICKSSKSGMFVTVWLGILDLKTGVMKCSNAGHEYPFIRGEDGVFRLFRDKHSLVIGALPDITYQDYEIQMHPGDMLFVYTDGVPDANNAEEEFYGTDRLEAALNRLANQNPENIIKGVRQDVSAFTGDAYQFDDLTMLCVEYKGI